MSILQTIKNNQYKVSQIDFVQINVLGVVKETEKATLWLLSGKNEPVEKWMPKSCFRAFEDNSIEVKGWFASKELFSFVDKKYFA